MQKLNQGKKYSSIKIVEWNDRARILKMCRKKIKRNLSLFESVFVILNRRRRSRASVRFRMAFFCEGSWKKCNWYFQFRLNKTCLTSPCKVPVNRYRAKSQMQTSDFMSCPLALTLRSSTCQIFLLQNWQKRHFLSSPGSPTRSQICQSLVKISTPFWTNSLKTRALLRVDWKHLDGQR